MFQPRVINGSGLAPVAQHNPVRADLSQGKAEYAASELRQMLQQLFPHRRLVLSQFTFFNHAGVAKPTGESFRRGRRCYRLEDVLSIACVLALKEEGIPLKNITTVPNLIQEASAEIFKVGSGYKLSGYGETVALVAPGASTENAALLAYLDDSEGQKLFWTYDIGVLAQQLRQVALSESVSIARVA